MKKEEDLIPAILPEDYRGSVSDWMVKLQERGFWNGVGWHGDIMIPASDWWEMLEECEDNEHDEVSEFSAEDAKSLILELMNRPEDQEVTPAELAMLDATYYIEDFDILEFMLKELRKRNKYGNS